MEAIERWDLAEIFEDVEGVEERTRSAVRRRQIL